MSYAALQDLIDRFGQTELVQLTDRTNVPPTTVDETVVDRALDDADAMIDSYLGGRYALPVSSTPDALVKVAADLARYFLHGKAADKDSPVTAANNQAIAWLVNVSKGLVVLEIAGKEAPQQGGGSVRSKAPCRVFTRDSLRRF